MSKALSGTTVIDFSHQQSGPSCTQLLAWLGADVIKVEKPDGGDMTRGLAADGRGDSYFFQLLNSGKRSVTLNMKEPRGRDMAMGLLDTADVLVENLGPGAMDRLGLGYEAVSARCPRLVYASVKGAGSSGPYQDYKFYESIAQAMSGLMSMTGQSEGPPTLTAANVGDSGSGLHLAVGILAALLHRERTESGQLVEVSMQEAALSLARVKWNRTLESGRAQPRTGNRSVTGTYADLLTCRGGGPNDYAYLMLPHGEERSFAVLTDVTGLTVLRTDPRFATAADRAANSSALTKELETWTRQHDKRHVLRVLAGHGLACGAVLDTKDVLDDEHLRSRGMVTEVDHPTRGRVTTIGNPIRLSKSPTVVGRAPLLGEHTGEVLAGHGLVDEADLDQLRRERVV